MRRLLPLLLLLGCRAEPIDDYPTDSGANDAGACRATTDACAGHDEDCDGVPDACDDCPGLFGPSCPPEAPGAFRRAFFDSFALEGPRHAPITSLGGLQPMHVVPDLVLGGASNGPGSTESPMMIFGLEPRPSAVVATTVLRVRQNNGAAGLMVRVSGSGSRRFLGCLVDNSTMPRLVALRSPDAGCEPSSCHLFADEAAAAGFALASTSLSLSVGEPIALRALWVSGRLECRAFSPETREGTIAVLDVGTAEAGDVGLISRHTDVEFRFLDVLVPSGT